MNPLTAATRHGPPTGRDRWAAIQQMLHACFSMCKNITGSDSGALLIGTFTTASPRKTVGLKQSMHSFCALTSKWKTLIGSSAADDRGMQSTRADSKTKLDVTTSWPPPESYRLEVCCCASGSGGGCKAGRMSGSPMNKLV